MNIIQYIMVSNYYTDFNLNGNRIINASIDSDSVSLNNFTPSAEEYYECELNNLDNITSAIEKLDRKLEILSSGWKLISEIQVEEGVTYTLPTFENIDGLMIDYYHPAYTHNVDSSSYFIVYGTGTLFRMPFTIPHKTYGGVGIIEIIGDAVMTRSMSHETPNHGGRPMTVNTIIDPINYRSARPYLGSPTYGVFDYTETISIFIKPRLR